MEKKCSNCNLLKEHHAKGLCYSCYRKLTWKPRIITCKRCQRELPLHAKDLCAGCFNFIFRSKENKAFNYRKWHNIDSTLYKQITQKCIICGFESIVELHHLSGNKKDNTPKNLIGLCPNHHKMIHNYAFRAEIFKILKEKGFVLPEDKKLDFQQISKKTE